MRVRLVPQGLPSGGYVFKSLVSANSTTPALGEEHRKISYLALAAVVGLLPMTATVPRLCPEFCPDDNPHSPSKSANHKPNIQPAGWSRSRSRCWSHSNFFRNIIKRTNVGAGAQASTAAAVNGDPPATVLSG